MCSDVLHNLYHIRLAKVYEFVTIRDWICEAFFIFFSARRPPLELLFVELHEEAPVARSVSDLGATIRRPWAGSVTSKGRNNIDST